MINVAVFLLAEGVLNRLRSKGPLRAHLSAWVQRAAARRYWGYPGSITSVGTPDGSTKVSGIPGEHVSPPGSVAAWAHRTAAQRYRGYPGVRDDDADTDDGEGSYLLPSLFRHHLFML